MFLNESELIEIKVPPAFVYNNFISEETYRQGQLIFPSFDKGAWKYSFAEGLQIIRFGERKAYSIPINNKKLLNNSPFKDYRQLLKDENTNAIEYFVFKNDIREVLSNSNYQILLVTAVSHNSSGLPSVKTLNKQVNFLLKETDTLAVFEVRQDPILKDSTKLLPYQVYNGLEKTSLFSLSLPNNPTPFFSGMEIEGFIEKQPFIIKLKGSLFDWKEIILNDDTAAWVIGAEQPEKIYIKNNALTASLLNQLLMIAFSPFTISMEIQVEIPVKR